MFSKVNRALTPLVRRFDREEGQSLAEYGLLLSLIVVVCVLAVTALGFAIAGILGGVVSNL